MSDVTAVDRAILSFLARPGARGHRAALIARALSRPYGGTVFRLRRLEEIGRVTEQEGVWSLTTAGEAVAE